jgi:hypothetical protein
MSNALGIPLNPYLGNDFTVEIDNKAKWSGTDTFTGKFSNIQTYLPTIGGACPRLGWEFLSVESLRIDNIHGDLCTVSVVYTGSNNADFEFDSATSNDFTYELAITSSEEPIETHPRYRKPADVPVAEKEIIGNVKLGMLKRVTAGQYQFKDIHDDQIYTISTTLGKELVDFILAGVVSYLHARQTWRERYQNNSLPSSARLNKVGKIDVPKGAPSVSDGRNWLFVGMNASQEGDIFTIVSEWELSGDEGWYSQLYT